MRTCKQARLSVFTLAALAALAGLPARADVAATGSFGTWPNALPIGPGDTDLGTNGLSVGNGAAGSFSVLAGSQFSAASIGFGAGGTGSGTGLIDGTGTRVTLTSDGNSNRLDVGNWGTGELTVSGGAVLDGRANAAACLAGNKWCHNFIGNAAGSSATFTVTGAGSEASFLRAFVVGGLAVFRPPLADFTMGTPGGTTQARVNVLAGGKLTTDGAQIGSAPGGSSPLGTERSIADVSIDGAGSLWHVTGGTVEAGNAFISMGNHRNAITSLSVTTGGELRFQGPQGRYSGINLSNNGGRADMLVSGTGSRVSYLSDAGVLQVGQALGNASLAVREGGQIEGLYYMSVGRTAAFGDMSIEGSGSLLKINGTASAAANGASATAVLDIGRDGGFGTVSVAGGGMIHLLSAQGASSGSVLTLGRDANSFGSLDITGAGSVVKLESISSVPGGGTGETLNPTVRVGRDGGGALSVTGGGKLLLEGGAVSTPAVRRSTSIYIGGASDTAVGGTGIATVSGAGSEIRVTGGDTFFGVGIGPQSNGTLTVSNGASISAMGLNVGRSGGVGVLKVDNAALNMSGQQSAGNQSGGFFVVGNGGGIGVATLDHGSVVTLSNMSSAGAGMYVGGSPNFTGGGEGTVTLAGGSSIVVQAAPGLGGAVIGREGSGFMRMKGASTMDLGGGALYVGRMSGGDGTLLITEGSSVSAGWVGVGRERIAGVESDGGTGNLILVNSTLNAQNIVIGSKGLLCGTGTITGNITNYGTFCPGNSPGTLRVDGNYEAAAGSRMVLEVQGSSATGFETDVLIFGGSVDLSHAQIEFRFLGGTDPNEFMAAGKFDIDTFLGHDDGSGGKTALGDASFAGTQFSAAAEGYVFTSFSYSAESGAVFAAQAVPEPASWLLWLGGAGLLAAVRPRRPALKVALR